MTKVEKFLLEKGISRNEFEEALSLLVECLHDCTQELKIEVEPEPVSYPPGFFKPDEKQSYNFIDYCYAKTGGSIKTDHEVDNGRLSLGNIYQTEDQAQQALDQKKAYSDLIRLIAELNHREGWVCDWDKIKQPKWCFYFNHSANTLTADYYCSIQGTKSELYFKSSLTDELISTLTPEKIKLALWGIRQLDIEDAQDRSDL